MASTIFSKAKDLKVTASHMHRNMW